uniref:Glycophorin C (Gerbich blood group) n=1 Tax=Lepisosteus oculatus TaxID=7918 RepID=W5LW24_LEPOC|nr:PREDICTED: glycophorin-C isoform X2 [Lepisosteus oculatus]
MADNTSTPTLLDSTITFSEPTSPSSKFFDEKFSPEGEKVGPKDGGADTAVIAGVTVALLLVLLCLLGVLIHYMYRHKGTYRTNEAKGTEFAETADVALKSDPSLQDTVDETKKEYFI